jgi:hypothetical protein
MSVLCASTRKPEPLAEMGIAATSVTATAATVMRNI